MPTFILERHLHSGALAAVLPDFEPPPISLYAVYPPGRPLAAKVRAFIDFAVAGYRVTRGGTIIVASFSVTAKETIGGVVYKKTPAPRIATFRFDKGRWTLISYGNFNAPS